MVVSQSEVVKKSAVVPAVSAKAQIRSFLPDDALHLMQHHLRVPCLIVAATHGFLSPQPSFRP